MRLLPAACLLLTALWLPGCANDTFAPRSCETALPDTVSFSRDILPVFNRHCNTAGCHSGTRPEGNLNLEPSVAYSQLARPGKGYLDPADPKGSLLYSQMTSVSDPMPPTGPLDSCTTRLIYRWMKQNAPNN